jgi:uncharacterized membrane protein YadS
MTFISSTKLAEPLNDRAGDRLPSAIQRRPRRNSRAILPGLFLNSVVAGAAFAIRQLPGMATFNPMILSIVIGIAFYNISGTAASAKQGVTFSLRWLLRIAIFPLGLQLTSSQAIETGGGGLGMIAATVRACFAFTIWIGELLGVEPTLAQVIAAATSICGASAVIAANTVTNTHDEEVAYAIACVTVFGSVVMFARPIAADAKAWIVAATTLLPIALAAIDPETDIAKLAAKGFRPALLGTLAFLLIAGFSLSLIKLME